MYIVSLFAKGKSVIIRCNSKEEAEIYGSTYWHLSPVITTPTGERLIPSAKYTADSEY